MGLKDKAADLVAGVEMVITEVYCLSQVERLAVNAMMDKIVVDSPLNNIKTPSETLLIFREAVKRVREGEGY